MIRSYSKEILVMDMEVQYYFGLSGVCVLVPYFTTKCEIKS